MSNLKNNKSKIFLEKINQLKDISGFSNVSKIKSKTDKGFSWIYRYKENGNDKTIKNIHLNILKYYVLLNNLEWEIDDKNQANKSIELEKSNYHYYDTGSGILFLDIKNNKNSLFNGFWCYKFDEYEIYNISFNNLKDEVLSKNLPWIVLNKNNADKSSKRDLPLDFESGICMVKKIKHDIYHTCFQWAFIFEKSDGGYDYIKNDNLNLLKKDILKKDFTWNILDENKYEKSLKENKINLDKIEHFEWTYTGFDKVKKRVYDNILQGFLWTYRYKKNYKQIQLSSINLIELKKKVLDNGLDWVILDEDKASESLRENMENFEKYGFKTNCNTTGIKHVYKSKNNSKQGFSWCYKKIINKETYKFSSVDLRILKQKVLNNDLDWIILDEDKAKESFMDNLKNFKKKKYLGTSIGTGIKNVYKSEKNSKLGLEWCYNKKINKNRYYFSSFDLEILKQKILNKGLDWEILDEDLAKKSFKENKEKMEKFKKMDLRELAEFLENN